MNPSRRIFMALLLASCVGDLARRGAQEECLFNGDCALPLVCAAGRCRAPCAGDRDCANGFRCLPEFPRTCGDVPCAAPSKRVCVEPAGPPVCFEDRDCDGAERVCASDLQCRYRCRASTDGSIDPLTADYDCQARFGAGFRCDVSGAAPVCAPGGSP